MQTTSAYWNTFVYGVDVYLFLTWSSLLILLHRLMRHLQYKQTNVVTKDSINPIKLIPRILLVYYRITLLLKTNIHGPRNT